MGSRALLTLYAVVGGCALGALAVKSVAWVHPIAAASSRIVAALDAVLRGL